MLKSFETLKKIPTIWVKILNKIVNKMNNTILLMIAMKPKDAIRLDTVPLEKKYPEETVLPKMDYIDIFINLANNMKTKKDEQ